MKHKIIIAGGRDLHKKLSMDAFSIDAARAAKQMGIDLILDRREIEIVSGKAPGADTMGENLAEILTIPVIPFPADWDNLEAKPCRVKQNKRTGKLYNVLAGFNRNTQMLNYANKLIAFWDGESTGTKDMITKATEAFGAQNVVVIHY